jgi:hypothetical protein
MTCPACDDRRFPIQRDAASPGGPATIPWSVAEKAYVKYSANRGNVRSLELLANLGGFSLAELDALLPEWRAEVTDRSGPPARARAAARVRARV